jgi:molecular chaperone GrpE
VTSPGAGDEPISFVDKRRIDPETGEVRDAPGQLNDEDTGAVAAAEEILAEADAEPEVVAEVVEEADASLPASDLQAELAERTMDLQRLQAEYANYRRRTDREKQEAAARGKAAVAEQLLPVLDDLDRARQHGDLADGPMKGIADKLTTVLTGLGLREFGAVGDTFDPELHEAVQNEGTGSDLVLSIVMRKGYKLGDRVLRHAMVAVADRPEG